MKKIEFPIVSSVITIALVHMIMLLRIFALYGAHAPILASLILLLVGEVVIILIASYVINPWDSSVPGCLLGRAPSNTTSSLYWTIPIIDDTIIFILTLKKSKQYAKLTKGIPISLMKVFLRDGFLYYLILGILHALNALLFLFAPPALKGVASGFLQSIATITISRLLFNLRMRARQEHSNNGLTAQTFETGATTKSMVNLTTVCSIFARFNAGRESDIPDHSSGIHALRSSPSNMGAIRLLPTVATERIRSGGGRSFEIQVDGPYYG
ncbi:hypothetical protein K439DRAFT_31190 [Ramaria rubella]|nr:hypothetical protein K439DRAFT_31190 [Ramaria rubella]